MYVLCSQRLLGLNISYLLSEISQGPWTADQAQVGLSGLHGHTVPFSLVVKWMKDEGMEVLLIILN